MAEIRKQKEQPEDQEGIRHLSKLRDRYSNSIKDNKNISIGKSLKRPKKFLFPIKLHINLIFFLSIISLINCQRQLRSNSSFITLRLNHSSYFLNASFLPLPDKVYIDDTPQERSKWEGKFINITSMYQVIKLEWNDKLINTSENTKLIIDYTRSRIVYCANLNSLSKFSYYTIGFDSIKDIEYHKNGRNIFLRVYVNKKDIIDISCKKSEVAYYILAQIKIILNEK